MQWGKREQIVTYFFGLAVLLFPVYWTLTSPLRSPLPDEQIEFAERFIYNEIKSNEQREREFLSWKVFLTVTLLEVGDKLHNDTILFEEIKEKLTGQEWNWESNIEHQLELHTRTLIIPKPEKKLATAGLTLTQSSYYLGHLITDNFVGEMDEFLHSQLFLLPKRGRFEIFLIPLSLSSPSLRSQKFFGKYRHGWTNVSPSSTPSFVADEVLSLTELFVIGKKNLHEKEERVRVKSSPSYRLSFSLLNSNFKLIASSWDIQAALNKYLQPFLAEISPLGRFHVDSQIQNYVSLTRPAQKDQKDSLFYYDETSLPYLINSNDWIEDPVATNQTSLNFLILVPDCKFFPLHIKRKDGSKAPFNAYLLPRSGGVIFHNRKEMCHNSSSTSEQEFGTYVIQFQEFSSLFPLIISQLRSLLGVPSLQDQASNIQIIPQSKKRNKSVGGRLLDKGKRN
eukprot:TRINITY_DN3702_c0_g1_i1.p1 TRINITY_DN3702_c0_g1~~TRINITY_DN3702_c0_g1_i1.p1  ORF type:complete len:452 (-),score=89.52 TRINITY_DN3702_c0_g1_i1:830-2185(-)